MKRLKPKGVFCLEGDWEADLRSKKSIDPVLQLLERNNQPSVPYIRRDIGTVQEFEYYLRKWKQHRYAKYPILYLGFHGDPGALYIGDGRSGPLTLDWIEERLADSCKGRIIHFGSCGTLAPHGKRLNRFLERTRAVAVCGYRVDIDWMLSAAFEIVLLSAFQQNTFTRAGMRAAKRRILCEAKGMAKDLAFRMLIAN